MTSNTSLMFWHDILEKMVIWKEREHDIDDIRGETDVETVASLRGYGLLKLFNVPSMRSQLRLLEYIPRMWNLE